MDWFATLVGFVLGAIGGFGLMVLGLRVLNRRVRVTLADYERQQEAFWGTRDRATTSRLLRHHKRILEELCDRNGMNFDCYGES